MSLGVDLSRMENYFCSILEMILSTYELGLSYKMDAKRKEREPDSYSLVYLRVRLLREAGKHRATCGKSNR